MLSLQIIDDIYNLEKNVKKEIIFLITYLMKYNYNEGDLDHEYYY